MAYVSTSQMLKAALEGGYAIGAFNIENMETALAVVAAAEELKSPVILQTTPSTVKYAGLDMLRAIGFTAAARASVPVALHLDHGESYELAASAIAAGYSSVMIDGSKLSLKENISLTRRVVNAARQAGVPVEAELGRVGGKEDDYDGGAGGYTDPDDAAEFVRATGVGSLAVGIGTAHGFYKSAPRLDTARLREIRARLASAGLLLPLVLHGASGLSDDAIVECIAGGICKVNFATELREAYTKGVRQVLADPAVYDPKKFGRAGMEKLKEAVMARIHICGSAGRA
ncbi:MAG: class II fructose-bisphosphate aldolase [Clostridiales bacterium]|nr:class II fructose-bisphosphate aldolase [Clostridiales bacterium]HOA84919.1 class II fructose-bisphosphate aldolase [Bacillota bacterium]